MNRHRTSSRWIDLTHRGGHTLRALAGGLLALTLAACGGGGSGSTAAPPAGGSPAAPTALNIVITGASISSSPVVSFKVTDQNGSGMAGLRDADLRFNIAKL